MTSAKNAAHIEHWFDIDKIVYKKL